MDFSLWGGEIRTLDDIERKGDAVIYEAYDDQELEVGQVIIFEREGVYDVTFVTEGRTYKIHTTDNQKQGAVVGLKFDKDDIHVMEKMVG